MPVGGQIVDENPPSGKVLNGEPIELSFGIHDAGTVRGKAGFPGILGHDFAVRAVDVHHIHVTGLGLTLPFIHDEAHSLAVRRNVGVHLVSARRLGEIHRVRAVGVHLEELPVAVAPGLVDDLIGQISQFRLEFRALIRGAAAVPPPSHPVADSAMPREMPIDFQSLRRIVGKPFGVSNLIGRSSSFASLFELGEPPRVIVTDRAVHWP